MNCKLIVSELTFCFQSSVLICRIVITAPARQSNDICMKQIVSVSFNMLCKTFKLVDAHGDILLDGGANEKNSESDYGRVDLPDCHDVYAIGDFDGTR
jgi:hypothetical protein